ncbi:outer membrane transport energization protein TonB [Mucilaginibacter mallensis]|uniref:Outer membrane transport energization protein TonB n=1 Tax=Mucilaginibacter mallensis TaxID=652787 RepID=A0A1H1TXJ6_MUCMA|nr:energy transducer TonB [Mucilaginibacter mallensis]SDS64957.1 outer membrane transport energization protein TonB [Mucilaginibacter mallensis]
MLISKFDLYKSEWLELVFDDRNKAYGAYELRQHYSRTMLKSMAIAFLTITGIALLIGVLIKPVAKAIVPTETIIPVTLKDYVHQAVVHPPKPITHIHQPAAPRALTVPTKAYIPFVVSPKPAITEPPKVSTLPGNIGPVDVKGTTTTTGPVDVPGKGGPGIDPGTVSNEPVNVGGLDVMPQPFGGASAWSKFLQKHLRYPDGAVNDHIQGKVWLSFIIERDGHLSNITVDRGPGYGLDEEALRVLKLAPAWKPGMQNGQPVRVKYNIPINFQLGDDGN